MTYKEFCGKFKRIRKAKEITVEKMASDLKQTSKHILNIENGKTEMRISEFLGWCEYFDISPRGFFDNPHPFKTLHHKKICEKLEELEGKDFEMMRRIVNAVYTHRK